MDPVVLIACSKSKLPGASPAKDFYTGGLFKLSVAYAQASGLEWVVLSTKHGVLAPGDRVEPYSHSFSDDDLAYAGEDKRKVKASEGYRLEWGRRVNVELKRRFPGRRFVSLLGRQYECCLAGLEVEHPMEGLRIGERLAWLDRACASRQEELWTT